MLALLPRLLFTTIGVAIALGLMFVVRELAPEESLIADPNIWDIFFTVFGLIYAIMVGFLLLDVLNRFHAMSSIIQDELNAVEDIRDFLIYLDKNEQTKISIKGNLQQYVNSVADQEWPIMVAGRSQGLLRSFQLGSRNHQDIEDHVSQLDSDTTHELYEIMRAVENIEIFDQSDTIALSAIIGKIGDTTSFRTKRIELSRQTLPPTLRFLIIFMSFVIASGFLFLNVESVWIHSLMVASINSAMHLLYMVISDLDQPFSGLWSINSNSLKHFEESLREEIARDRQALLAG